jgi:hypothetical protein
MSARATATERIGRLGMSPLARFGLAIGFLIAATVLFGTVEMNGTFSAQTAAWVQAIGAIGAIVGAVWLQDRQRERQRQDREQAYGLAAIEMIKGALGILCDAAGYARSGILAKLEADFIARKIGNRLLYFEYIDGSNYHPKVYVEINAIISSIQDALIILELSDKTKDITLLDKEIFVYVAQRVELKYQNVRRAYALPKDERASALVVELPKIGGEVN